MEWFFFLFAVPIFIISGLFAFILRFMMPVVNPL
jgi:hypothetical protein